MKEKETEIFERCKNEISEKQFLALVRLRNRMKEIGWKKEKITNPIGKNIVIVCIDTANRRHWIQVDSEGDTIGLPVEMRCRC